MTSRYGYDNRNKPFHIVERDDDTVEIVDMNTGEYLFIPRSVWLDMVADWAEHLSDHHR